MRPIPAVPSNVAEAVCKRWPDRGPRWLNEVHDELTALCERYEAEPVQVMRARYGFVVEVSTATGLLIMRGSPDPNGVNQAKVSFALAKRGVSPTVWEWSATDSGTWTVMDRVQPGTPIGELGDRVDLAALAAMLRPLVSQPVPSPDMPSLLDWLRRRLIDPDLADLPVGQIPAPAPERRQALQVLNELSKDSMTGLCHADASTRNILAGEDTGYSLIDPRGLTGDVAYDVAVVALKVRLQMPPAAGAKYLAHLVGVDPARADAWIGVASTARV